MTYTWRESTDFQLARVRRHFRADLAEWARSLGANVTANAWSNLDDLVWNFSNEYLDLYEQSRAAPERKRRPHAA